MTLQECVLSGRQYPSRLPLTKHCAAWRAPSAYLITRQLISLLSSPSLLVDYVVGRRLSRPRQNGVCAASLQALARQVSAWPQRCPSLPHPLLLRLNAALPHLIYLLLTCSSITCPS